MSEDVLVLRSSDLNIPEGLIYLEEKEAVSLLKEGFFLDRSVAEGDERFRQVIPYVVLLEDGKVLLVRRTERQGEKRLHGLYSIGIGGHVRKEDGRDPVEAFWHGLWRELEEEVDVNLERLDFIGLINDLSSEVSRVHLGFLFIGEGKIRGIREEEMFEWWIVKVEDLENYSERMEGWSRLALEGLKSYLSRRST